MDLNYTDEDIRFRDEVRAFIDEAFTPDLQQQMSRSKNGYMSKQAHLIWQKRLYEKGWAAPNWPAEHGGRASRRPRSLSTRKKWMLPVHRISFRSA